VVDCLRAKNSKQLLVDGKLKEFVWMPFWTPNDDFPWSPSDQALNGSTTSHIESLLVGHNSEEYSFALPFAEKYFSAYEAPKLPANLTNIEDFKDWVREMIASKVDTSRFGSAEAAFDLLLGSKPTYEPNPMNFVKRFFKNSYRLLTCDIKMYAEDVIRRSVDKKAKVFMYKFTQTNIEFHAWMGATHGAENSFLFGKPLIQPDKYTHLEIELSKRLMRSWANFAKTGRMLNQLNLEWEAFNERNDFILELKAGQAVGHSNKDEKFCDTFKLLLELGA